ncbi:Krueppel homolog 1 [Stomoxys calcitrans]|uniref:Krueppel homolog 1 n=1 Tax=Stomoxys calcitrans TaxID=35570 RepID=UPI0027E3834A|nr:Krueppel homolog 1 [Stomoxys calcitrans]XP_059220170.1 Krueppel homolog 1 [Stomoxys calcitrans]
MVYYQSTPLIIKSEQPSQAELCGPLRTTTTTTTLDHLPLHLQQQQQHHQQQLQHQQSIGTYSLNNVSLNVQQISQNNANSSISHIQQLQHEHLQQQQQHQQQHHQYLTNIKTELLPSGITLYATTSQPASLNTTTTNQNVTISSTSGNTSHTVPLPTSTTPGAVGRKANPNKPQFKCEQCGMTFGSKSAHTSHTKSHVKNGDLSLMSGNGSVNTALNVGYEVNADGLPLGIPKTPQIKPNANAASNGGDPYQCNVCQKTFAVPARLIRHYRTHTGERPFECEFCHKLFSVKENLQVHRRIHTKERPYKCEVCGRAFEHSGKLHRHMRIHTGERPHKCSVCDKTFIQSGQLVIHMRTHTGEKPYKCPVEGCGKGFTCSKQLKVHSRTHTGEKPYHCDICFRDFGYNHVLKLHRVQHYGSKCYKCTICDETFKSKKEMEAHIKGHANEIPDEEEEAAAAAAANSVTSNNGNANNSPSSVSTSSGVETISGPSSPQSPSSSIGTIASSTTATATTKQRKPRQEKPRSISTSGPLSPGSPGSPTSSMSPSSSYASASRLSAGSPTSSVASPTMSLGMETDHHSRDSGVASGSTPTSSATRQLAAATLMDMSNQANFPLADEMPTDLSVGQQQQHHHSQHNQHNQPNHLEQQHVNYHYQSSSPPTSQTPTHYHYVQTTHNSASTPLDLHQHSIAGHFEQPTINPALLEAATIASRGEDDVQQAAIQIMQLHRSQQKSNSLASNSSNGQASLYPEVQRHGSQDIHQNMIIDQFGEVQEANEIIERYKRNELTRQGLTTKGYAPVPKFESSFQNNEIILRQVEAAIAPLRSSAESPERSSSPESDMLMADRDVMTLPLRKRKLYMSDCAEAGEMEVNGGNIAKEEGQKVMRHSSVIQFAKAS